eukprot:4688106-Alexandrium_andersonii.AAC.1
MAKPGRPKLEHRNSHPDPRNPAQEGPTLQPPRTTTTEVPNARKAGTDTGNPSTQTRNPKHP